MIDTDAPARLLAIEPDPESGAVLYRILSNRVSAEVGIVCGIDEALASVADHVPDLILTSTFLRPADLARLIDDLRRRDDATHTQVITTPHFLEAPESDSFEDESVRVLRFPRQRTADGRFHCDPVVLRNQVKQYLDQARALRVAARDRQQQGLVLSTSLVSGHSLLDPWKPAGLSTAQVTATPQDFLALTSSLRPSDRRRASRRRAADLAGQWGVRLSPEGEASIVDISRTGVRLETSTLLNPGSLIDLEVIDLEGSSHAVGARLIRSEAIETGGPEVKYRAAAMFLHEIDLFAANANPILVAAAAAGSYTPRVLADLLGRALANANWVSNGQTLRSAFETELAALIRAKEVRIRAVPVRTAGGCQSLYFRIPTTTPPEHGLHAVFERGYRPTAAEFRLLKAAASLAAVVLDLAPAPEVPPAKN